MYFLQKLTQLWHLDQEATENMVCACMHVVFSFTINESKRKQIDEHISHFEQYRAARKEGHQTKPRDADTAGVNATELKVRYPPIPFVKRKTVESLHIHTILIT